MRSGLFLFALSIAAIRGVWKTASLACRINTMLSKRGVF